MRMVSSRNYLILPSGDDVIEALKEGSELLPDGSSHLHLTNQLDVVVLVLVSHLDKEVMI